MVAVRTFAAPPDPRTAFLAYLEDPELPVRVCAAGGIESASKKTLTASERASASDFRGLDQLRAAGQRFLTTGHRSFTHADGVHVMPIDRL